MRESTAAVAAAAGRRGPVGGMKRESRIRREKLGCLLHRLKGIRMGGMGMRMGRVRRIAVVGARVCGGVPALSVHRGLERVALIERPVQARKQGGRSSTLRERSLGALRWRVVRGRRYRDLRVGEKGIVGRRTTGKRRGKRRRQMRGEGGIEYVRLKGRERQWRACLRSILGEHHGVGLGGRGHRIGMRLRRRERTGSVAVVVVVVVVQMKLLLLMKRMRRLRKGLVGHERTGLGHERNGC